MHLSIMVSFMFLFIDFTHALFIHRLALLAMHANDLQSAKKHVQRALKGMSSLADSVSYGGVAVRGMALERRLDEVFLRD